MKEQLIFARNRWEIALVETNAVTSKPQWVRRDTSYICDVGAEVAKQPMPAKPVARATPAPDAYTDVLEELARSDGACLYWQMGERAQAALAAGAIKQDDELLVHPKAIVIEPGTAYRMPPRINLDNIQQSDLADAAIINDVDEALAPLQAMANIETGDVAAHVFSGFDWTAASYDERLYQLRSWVHTERMFAHDDENEDDNQ